MMIAGITARSSTSRLGPDRGHRRPRTAPFRSAVSFPLFLLFALALTLTGCGGGGGPFPGAPDPTGSGPTGSGQPQQTGRMLVSVVWPASSVSPSRLVPAAPNGLRVGVNLGATLVASALIARPATSYTFNNLPAGDFLVTAKAFPNADGTGTVQAQASTPLTINDGQTTPLSLTLASTIDHVDVTAASLSVALAHVVTLTATAKDAANAVVLTAPGAFTWSSSDPLVASVGALTGQVTGLVVGNATITATESESGKSGTYNISVVPLLSLSIGGSGGTVRAGVAQTFTATVEGSDNTTVTWSILEAPLGGSITAGGVYTPPTTPGTYHIVATSVADPARTGTFAVTLPTGTGGISIN